MVAQNLSHLSPLFRTWRAVSCHSQPNTGPGWACVVWTHGCLWLPHRPRADTIASANPLQEWDIGWGLGGQPSWCIRWVIILVHGDDPSQALQSHTLGQGLFVHTDEKEGTSLLKRRSVWRFRTSGCQHALYLGEPSCCEQPHSRP